MCLVPLLLGGTRAYVDPGTGIVLGSSLWTLMVAFFSTLAAFLAKHFWDPIKRVVKKTLKKLKR